MPANTVFINRVPENRRKTSENNPSGKTIPQDIEAEKSVLAACMLNQDAIVEVVTKLKPENFFRPAHQRIFASMVDLNTRSIPVDQISLADNLKAKGELEAVGGKSYLVELASNTFAITNWLNHTEIVKRNSILRNLIYASTQITALAYDAPDDLNLVVEEAEKILFGVTEQRVSSSFVKADELAVRAYDELFEMKSRKRSISGIPTGFKDLDDLFHGLRGGDLIILAARPGVGKTAFALNVAINAAKADTTVAFLSLEMSSSQLIQRVLCAEARVRLEKLRGGRIDESDWPLLVGACELITDLDFYIDDTPGLSILELRAKARRELRGKEKGLIVVDYLQLMQAPQKGRYSNRDTEVGEISRGLKILAKEMNMPVLALSQLNREVERRTSKRPQLSDLRESGSIEQDADIVMFIDRSMDDSEVENNERKGERKKGERPPPGTADIIIAKHRNGPTASIRVAYSGEYTSFRDHFDDSRIR